MKKSYKILLFVISLTGFGFSAGILALSYPKPIAIETLMAWQSYYPWFNAAFAGYIASICLFFLALMFVALFLPGKPHDLALQKDKGRLLFSRQSVESTVRYSFADVDGVNFSKVRVKLGSQPEKTRIFIKLSVSDTTKLVGLTQDVQDRIDSALKSSLSITARSIDIKVVESAPVQDARKEESTDLVKSSRVE